MRVGGSNIDKFMPTFESGLEVGQAVINSIFLSADQIRNNIFQLRHLLLCIDLLLPWPTNEEDITEETELLSSVFQNLMKSYLRQLVITFKDGEDHERVQRVTDFVLSLEQLDDRNNILTTAPADRRSLFPRFNSQYETFSPKPLNSPEWPLADGCM